MMPRLGILKAPVRTGVEPAWAEEACSMVWPTGGTAGGESGRALKRNYCVGLPSRRRYASCVFHRACDVV